MNAAERLSLSQRPVSKLRHHTADVTGTEVVVAFVELSRPSES